MKIAIGAIPKEEAEMNFNPGIELSMRDYDRAKAIQRGGLPVARQWYSYNTARRLVSFIKKNGLPETFACLWTSDSDGKLQEYLALFRIDVFLLKDVAGFVPAAPADYSVETAVLAVRLRQKGHVRKWVDA
ncbi:MAG: hypothetical protein AB1482_11090 [Pseudomonadota bacterium]